jgi:hypothetical protein
VVLPALSSTLANRYQPFPASKSLIGIVISAAAAVHSSGTGPQLPPLLPVPPLVLVVPAVELLVPAVELLVPAVELLLPPAATALPPLVLVVPAVMLAEPPAGVESSSSPWDEQPNAVRPSPMPSAMQKPRW